MRKGSKSSLVNRRAFLQQTARRASLLGLATALGDWSRAAIPDAASGTNPFAYDLSRFARTDPQLIGYEPRLRLKSRRTDPRGIAIGPGDRISIAAGNYISTLDAEGSLQSEIALEGTTRCLSYAPGGEIYVGLRDHIEVFDNRGSRAASWPVADGKAWFTGLAVTKKAVFVADAGNRVVWRYDRSGQLVGRIGGAKASHSGFIVPSPFFNVAVHADGLLRVTNPGRHRVEAYTQEGDFEFAWGKPSAAMEGFCGCCNPIGLALLPDGRVVTCEKGLPRVKVYGVDGTFQCVVAGVESFPDNARVCAGEVSDKTSGGLAVAVNSAGWVHILDLVTGDIHVLQPKAGFAPRKGRPAA